MCVYVCLNVYGWMCDARGEHRLTLLHVANVVWCLLQLPARRTQPAVQSSSYLPGGEF